MSKLLEKIKNDLNQTLKAKKAAEVSVLRFLLADLHNREIEKKGELTDGEVVATIRKQVKLRKESVAAFKKGKRDDLVQKEREEIEILSKYLPQTLSSNEIEKAVDASIKKTGAKSTQDFGKVMGETMKALKGQAEGNVVAELVKKKLS
jgi:hypothetical protein